MMTRLCNRGGWGLVACGTIVTMLAGLAYGQQSQPAAAVVGPNGGGLGVSLWSVSKPERALRIYLRGIELPWWPERLKDQPLVLGEIRLPGVVKPAVDTVEADAVSQTVRLAGAADGQERELRVMVNRLSPAILIELTNATEVDLFTGDKTPRWAWGLASGADKDNIDGFCKAYPYPPKVPLADPGVPLNFAVSDGAAARLGKLAESPAAMDGAQKGWLLLWYGDRSWFFEGRSEEFRPGDAPMLLVCSETPTMSAVNPGSNGVSDAIHVSFPRKGARIALMPLMGYRFPLAKETAAWRESLPEAVTKAADWWATHLAEWPRTVKEVTRYDAQAHAAVFQESFEFVRLREGGTRLAPLPPMLELARQGGLPITVSAPPVDSGLVTYCGPYVGVEWAAQYEYRITGLDKYAMETRRMGPVSATAPATLKRAQEELNQEVDKMLAAGHLAPVNIPWKVAWSWGAFNLTSVRHVYFAPGQTLSVLADALPLLDEARQAKVREYLQTERQTYKPEVLPHLPSDKGARREPYKLTPHFVGVETNMLRQQNFHYRNRILPAEALYDLAAYYLAMGPAAVKGEEFDLPTACERTIQPWLRRQDWATLGWFSWPMDKRDPIYYGTYGWNQIHEANRMIAAAIGLVRLADLTGNAEWKQRGLVALSRGLAHRYALGKYPRWRHATGTLDVGAEYNPVWDAGGVTMSEQNVLLGFGNNQWGQLPYFSDVEGPLACMAPELGRFFADYLKPECQAIAEVEATFYPDGLLTYGTPRRTAEWWHNYPEDNRRIFLNHAWVLGESSDWLYRHADVPWVKVGDLYYIEKMAETIIAGRGATWQPWTK